MKIWDFSLFVIASPIYVKYIYILLFLYNDLFVYIDTCTPIWYVVGIIALCLMGFKRLYIFNLNLNLFLLLRILFYQLKNIISRTGLKADSESYFIGKRTVDDNKIKHVGYSNNNIRSNMYVLYVNNNIAKI